MVAEAHGVLKGTAVRSKKRRLAEFERTATTAGALEQRTEDFSRATARDMRRSGTAGCLLKMRVGVDVHEEFTSGTDLAQDHGQFSSHENQDDIRCVTIVSVEEIQDDHDTCEEGTDEVFACEKKSTSPFGVWKNVGKRIEMSSVVFVV